ncbi:MAG: LytTR family DNA-binding domain-containing protein [Eubacteriales bacterium]|nr:LytTR family DNA-binding domain-containing protein [Eubacteriales bacterium]
MLRIAICDDDDRFCGELEACILEYAKIYREAFDVSVYYSGEDLLEDLKKDIRYELIFLDIEMQEMNGIQVGMVLRKELNQFLTQIVYVTAFECYAKDLFQNQPFDFLLKPLVRDKVFSVLKEYQYRYDRANVFFEFVSHKNQNKVAVNEILYINSSGRKLLIHTRFEVYETYEKLSDFLQSSSGSSFIQIHKSFAVNLDHIIGYHYDYLRISDGERLDISRSFRQQVRERLLEEAI